MLTKLTEVVYQKFPELLLPYGFGLRPLPRPLFTEYPVGIPALLDPYNSVTRGLVTLVLGHKKLQVKVYQHLESHQDWSP